jgi:signal transduction histidine kinase
MGSGLRNMADRLVALGGRLEVRSAPGAGTTVTGQLPVAAVAAEPAVTGGAPALGR